MPDSNESGSTPGKVGLLPNTFEWNGVNCSNYGIVMLSPPTIISPKERYSNVTIPGRAGSLTIKENDYVYDNIQLSCTCIVLNTDRISDIAYWLRGTALLRFSNIGKDRYYKGRVSNQISFEKVLRGNKHRTFTIQFECEPFVYIDDPEKSVSFGQTDDEAELTFGEITADVGVPITANALGNFYAEPKLRLTFIQTNSSVSTDIKIYTINHNFEVVTTTTLLYNKVYNPSTGRRRTHYMIIDSDAKIAYYGDENMNHMIAGDWPILPTDFYAMLVDSHLVTSVEFTPRWRSLI